MTMSTPYKAKRRILNPVNARHYFEKRFQHMDPYFKRHESARVLDIGCKQGFFLKMMKERYPKHHYVGVDIDEIAIAEAGQEDPDVQCVVADAQSLCFDDECFDIVIMNSVLHHIPNMRLALDEAARVCRKGGYFFLCEPNPRSLAMVLLSLWKKDERGQLNMWPDRIKEMILPRANVLATFFLNSLIFPYRQWPSRNFFSMFQKFEDLPIFYILGKSHWLLICQKKEAC